MKTAECERLEKNSEEVTEKLETTCRENQQLKEQLRQTNSLAAMGEMMAAIAHEIRNPLGTIQLLAEELLQQQSNEGATPLSRPRSNEEERKDIANDILIATHSLNAIVSNLLRSVQPAKPHFKDIDLAGVLDEVMLFADYAIKGKGIRLERRCPHHGLLCEGDSEQLKQVMLNIILNAVQAMDSRGKLRISVGQLSVGGQRYIVLKVEDDGCGIPEELQGKIYNPFFTTKNRGLGLGLFVVRNLLQAHSANIEVKSKEGEGTIFTIYFPVRQDSRL